MERVFFLIWNFDTYIIYIKLELRNPYLIFISQFSCFNSFINRNLSNISKINDLVSLSVQFQKDIANRNQSHVNSTTYDDSFVNKSKLTNLSSNMSQEADMTRNRFPEVTQHSSWKSSSVYKPKFTTSTRKKQRGTSGKNVSRGVTLNQIFKNNILINSKIAKNEDIGNLNK